MSRSNSFIISSHYNSLVHYILLMFLLLNSFYLFYLNLISHFIYISIHLQYYNDLTSLIICTHLSNGLFIYDMKFQLPLKLQPTSHLHNDKYVNLTPISIE